MHILLIHQFFLEDQQGGGSRWNDMARIWVQQGHSITVLAGGQHYMGVSAGAVRKSLWDQSINGDGVSVIRCRGQKYFPKRFKERLWGFLRFAFLAGYAGLFRVRNRYDVVIATSPPLVLGTVAVFLGFFRRVPVIFEIRDLWPESAIEIGVLKPGLLVSFAFRLEKWIYNRSSLLVVLTPAFGRWLLERKGIMASKIRCIPNAADLELTRALVPSFHRERFRSLHDLEDRFVVVYVGAHGMANNLGVLLNWAEKLMDTPFLLLLIGDGREKESLMEEAERRRIINIRFISTLPKRQVMEYIMASDMGLSTLKPLPIFHTIFSNKTFDYMACRIPVLMTIDGISRELIEKAQAGVYVDIREPERMEATIRACMAEREKLKIWGDNGYHYVEKYYNRRHLALEYLIRIQSVVATPK
ncbi:glycosyltransferase family 4 protein [Dyadobacter tibetensis]|uniref:glycosyltransferase family 4 protein n=1 Tax=Dyadobacter tibetensis TaxID=1211851 RepID=UPI00047031DC|nr:glycosyltransferase family 4 protein [Dyadobacter tibetensis]